MHLSTRHIVQILTRLKVGSQVIQLAGGTFVVVAMVVIHVATVTLVVSYIFSATVVWDHCN